MPVHSFLCHAEHLGAPSHVMPPCVQCVLLKARQLVKSLGMISNLMASVVSALGVWKHANLLHASSSTSYFVLLRYDSGST